jgi:Protein of unknown function (DUF3667)
MKNNKCLNCGKQVIDKFCSSCGQKADTRRITFKNLIFHDILHGIFHFEKGMLFTARQSLIRPGKAALDYISGKRKPYYNVFYFILITIGLILFFKHFNDVLDGTNEIVKKSRKLNDASKSIDAILSQKSKLIIFLFVPFAALNSFILFRRKKLNFSEHAIIAGMILLGMLLILLFGNLVFYLELIIPFNKVLAQIISYSIILLAILQIGYGYFNAFAENYSNVGIAYRILLFFALMCFQIMIVFLIVFGIVSNWKFGELTVSI